MKELKLLTEWADSLLNEVDGKNSKENLPINQDPIRQTQIKNPHLSRDEAASKYLDDITKNFLDQNQVINAQRRENDKLKKTVADIAREVGDIEQDSSQTHSELERLKSLSGQLKTDVATRRISQSEVADILDKVKGLQGKPGISSEEYQELKQKVAEFKKGEVDPKQFEELKNRLERMGTQKSVDKGDFERLQALMTKVEQGQAEVERGRGDVNAKIADIERKQAEIEQREKGHDEQVKAEVEKEIKRAEEKRKRSTRASYNTSKRRLDKLEPRVDTLEPEIHKQEEINKKQDTKDEQHDKYLTKHEDYFHKQLKRDTEQDDRIHLLAKRIVSISPTGLEPQTPDDLGYSVKKRNASKVNEHVTSWPFNGVDNTPRPTSVLALAPPNNDPEEIISLKIEQELENLDLKIQRLLSPKKFNGKSLESKNAVERKIDIKKTVQLLNLLYNSVHNFYLDAKISNPSWSIFIHEDDLDCILDDILAKYSKKWYTKTGINILKYFTAIRFDPSTKKLNGGNNEQWSQWIIDASDMGYTYDYNGITKKDLEDRKKYSNRMNHPARPTRLPESLNSDLNNLAESILGPQLAKYLK